MESGIIGTVEMLRAAQARGNYHDDWERDFERLQQRADNQAFKQSVKGAVLRIVALFRIPAPRAAGTEAARA